MNIYFRTYAREIGCDTDALGDMAVWEYIIDYQRNRS